MKFEIKALKTNERASIARKHLETEYKEELNRILRQLRSGEKFITKQELIKRFYDWFFANVSYDNDILKMKNNNNSFTSIQYPYKDCVVNCGEKYAPILLHKGVCQSFSIVFKDFCDLIGVDCKIIRGRDENVVELKNKPHAWNEVLLDGEWSTIDLTPCYKTYMGKLRTHQNSKFIIHEDRSVVEST